MDFSGSKTISEIDVFTVQDNYSSPSEPTESMTFSSYGIKDFDVQYWNGSAWTTFPAAVSPIMIKCGANSHFRPL
ncbi:MAG TPA: hypothetical protein VEV84_13550, partial [Pyrinomonadaceae bacterium]|nr:hypothetical protein [Pyrinomonadaceae bacterium]